MGAAGARVVNGWADRRMSVPTRNRSPVGGSPHPSRTTGSEVVRSTGPRPEGERPSSATLGAKLANGLRHVWGPEGLSQRICRLRRISHEVQLLEHTQGDSRRLSYVGLSTCKSPLCPLCAPKWQRTRAEEISTAVQHWGPERVWFSTFTMRHHPGMALALQHRLLTAAFGHLWSGRKGQSLVRELGGKPESVRAHDRTWSYEKGWHPHLHSLLFLRTERHTEDELQHMLACRWVEALGEGLRRMQRFCSRTLARASQLSELCFDQRVAFQCLRGTDDFKADAQRAARGECAPPICPCLQCVRKRLRTKRCPCEQCNRRRAKRIFGVRLVPKAQPLLESVRRLSTLLEAFTEENLRPNDVNGAQIERARPGDRAANYLAKLGLELTWNESKAVNEVRGVKHFPYWAVAHLATKHGDPLRVPARRAWAELFRATRATQTITFSDREALGLGPDPYADGNEPEEAAPEEWTRVVGSIDGVTWDANAKEQKHGFLVTLAAAHEAGVLDELPYLQPPNVLHAIPFQREKPKIPARPTPHQQLENWAAHERRGEAIARDLFSQLPKPPEPEYFEPVQFFVYPKGQPRSVEEIRERLARSRQLRLNFSLDW